MSFVFGFNYVYFTSVKCCSLQRAAFVRVVKAGAHSGIQECNYRLIGAR